MPFGLRPAGFYPKFLAKTPGSRLRCISNGYFGALLASRLACLRAGCDRFGYTARALKKTNSILQLDPLVTYWWDIGVKVPKN